MNNPNEITVFSGLPCSGKSVFVRGLQKQGFSYFTLNGEDDQWRVDVAHIAAYRNYLAGNTAALLAAIRSAPAPAAVEYGFPPDTGNFTIVKALREGGARFVWFDCPIATARKRYAKREHNRPLAVAAFKRQAQLIVERWEDILLIASPQIVPVLRGGKAPRSHVDLYEEVFGKSE